MKKEFLDKHMSAFFDACQKNKIKITPQRVEIFRELIRYDDHPSVKKVYQRVKKKFPNISFDTVNRTLQTFANMGISKIVEGHENVRRYDGVVERHHHFHCLKCHRIIDIYDERLEKIDIPMDLDEKLTVFDSKIVFEGICDRCKKNSASGL